MSEDFLKEQIILVDKPLTWTSFNVVSKLKWAIRGQTGIKKFKIGHAGTLDPLATGLLIICVGKMTKKIETFQLLEKEYTGIIRLGATTPSFDLEKEIDETFDTSDITKEMIFETAKSFIGIQQQIPPIFSAVKINGKRAYDYARSGETVEIKSKEIDIKCFDILKIENNDVYFKIVCSKGTYIRSIARDFGEALNNGAHLFALRRTRIGEFLAENAINIEKVEQINKIFET